MLGRKLHSGTSKNKGKPGWTGKSSFVLDKYIEQINMEIGSWCIAKFWELILKELYGN